MQFRQFLLEQTRPIISYDFDGVLHTSLVQGTTHPQSFFDWESWQPNLEIHSQLRNDSKTADIIVISKRDDRHQPVMWNFIKYYNLPIKQIYTTNDMPKGETIIDLGSIKHYDDDKYVGNELAGSGVEFELVHTK